MSANTIYGVQVLFQNDTLYAAAGGDRTAAMKAHVDAAAALGVEVIRFPGDWRALQESGPDTYSAWYLDEVAETVAYAKSLGISVVMTFAQTPYWATDGSADPSSQAAIWAPPVGAAAEAYAEALVAFHDELAGAGVLDAVIAWEIWNEPNTTTFWPTGDVRPGTDVQVSLSSAAEYVTLLNTAYDALKAVDPSAVVLGGALAGCDTDYLSEMYALGAKFDALAVHPYTKADPFEDGIAYAPDETDARDPLSLTWSFKAGVEAIHDLMVAAGDAGKGIWFTEFGWSSTSAWGGAGSAADQAQFLAEALDIIEAWDFVDAAIAYRLFDGQGEEFGMYRADGTLKPSGEVLRDFLDGLGIELPAETIAGLETLSDTRTASFYSASSAVTATLDEINALLAAFGGADIPDLRNMAGSDFGDRFTGDAHDNRIGGGGGNDTLDGGDGNDVIVGGDGDNWLFGGADDDVITGGADCDWIEGGSGADTITGGGYHGHVVYWSSSQGVTVNLATGVTRGGDAEGDRLLGIIAVDGSELADVLTGSAGDNWVVGKGGNDVLNGLAGADRVDGGDGNDIVTGGRGADILIGGDGADRFDFNAVSESGRTSATRDVVVDFSRGEDRLDLSTIDASTRAGGNQTFRWIGTAAFHKHAGELHMVRTASGLLVEGDINGDARADFQIHLKSLTALAATDLIL